MLKKYTQQIISTLLFLLMCLATLFSNYKHYFVDNEVLMKWYTLYILILFSLLYICFTIKSINLTVDFISCTLFFLIIYIGGRQAVAPSFDVSVTFKCIAFLLLFFFFKLNRYLDEKVSVLVISLSCSLLAIYGILQFFSIIPNNSYFTIIGSFDNPAGFAASLCAGFIFIITLFGVNKYYNYILISLMLIMVLAIILSESRAGIISTIIVSVLFLYQKLKPELSGNKKCWMFLGTILFLIILIIFLVFIKKNSAIGRLLIWETSINMITAKPLFGLGADSFYSNYMINQADYFKNHPDSSYKLLADNVSHPFNEFLLLTIEYGLVGLILLLLLIYFIFRNRTKEIFPYQLSILSVVIFSCFSYPLRYPFVWLILAFSIAKVSNYSKKNIQCNIQVHVVLRIFFIFVILFLSYNLAKDIKFEFEWKKNINLISMGRVDETMIKYEILHKQWNGNPLFLYNYGAELNYVKSYQKSILILHECEKYYIDYDVCILLANSYLSMKNWSKAEIYYKEASKMCPNRFAPLDGLISVYDSIGNNVEAKKIVIKILQMPIKVESKRIDDIKYRAKLRLQM